MVTEKMHQRINNSSSSSITSSSIPSDSAAVGVQYQLSEWSDNQCSIRACRAVYKHHGPFLVHALRRYTGARQSVFDVW